MAQIAGSASRAAVSGPPRLDRIDHVSLPCRDLDEGIRFFRDVLGARLIVQEEAFALFELAGGHVGIGSVGATFMDPGTEYPHLAFHVGPDALVAMKDWLAACGIPTSPLWTRKGIETLMFFRDPSGNVIELACWEGYADAPNLARGPARGHGKTVDIDALRYDRWSVPDRG